MYKEMGNSNNYFFASGGGTRDTVILPASQAGYFIQMAGSGGGGGGGIDNKVIPRGGGGGGSGLFVNMLVPGSIYNVYISFTIGRGGKGGDFGSLGFNGDDTNIGVTANQRSVYFALPGGRGGTSVGVSYGSGDGGDGGTFGLNNIPVLPIGSIVDAWSFGGGGGRGTGIISEGKGGAGYKLDGNQLVVYPNFSGNNGNASNGSAQFFTRRAGYGGGLNGGLGGLHIVSQSSAVRPVNNSAGGGGAGIPPEILFKNSDSYITPARYPFNFKTDGLGRGAGFTQGNPPGSVIANKNEYGGGGGGGVGGIPNVLDSDKSANGGDGFIRIIKF